MANAQAVERILSQATTATLADLVMTFASTFPGQDTFTAACHLYMFYKEEEQSTQSEIVSVRHAITRCWFQFTFSLILCVSFEYYRFFSVV